MIDDPRLALLGRTLTQRPARQAARAPAVREAAVALLLRPRDALELLLIKRSQHEADPWSGHMALPGGRRDPVDRDLVATAFRETAEEIGIDLVRVGSLLGPLDEVEPQTSRLPPILIAPFVVAVPPDATTNPNPREVEAALWVPLSSLSDAKAVGEIVIELETGRRSFPSLRYGEHVIWGLTHRILIQFLELARSCGL